MRKKIDLDEYISFVNRTLRIIEESNFSDEINDKVRSLYSDYTSEDYSTYKLIDGEKLSSEDLCYLSESAMIIASYIVIVPDLYKRVFKKNTLNPSDFLNYFYFFDLLERYESEYNKLFELFANAFEDLSLNRLIMLVGDDMPDHSEEVSEVEFYDYLQGMNVRELTQIIEKVEASRDIKNTMKKAIIDDNDDDTFFSCCRNSNINFQKAGWIAKIWHTYNSMCKLFVSAVNEEDYPKQFRSFLGDENTIISEKYSETIYDIAAELSSNEKDLLWSDFYKWREMAGMAGGFVVAFYKECKQLSTNAEAITELGNYVQDECSYLYEQVTFENFDTCNYWACKPIDTFRDLYLTNLKLPPQVNKKKDKHDYYEASIIHDKQTCIKIFKELVKNNLVENNEETFYSLIYRLSFDYIGQFEPAPIVWYGKACELYQFIWWFAGDGADTRLWSKNTKFFVLSNGDTIKTNGVKNQAATPTKRMEVVFKALKQ